MGLFDWMRTGGQGLNLDPSQFQSPETAQMQQVPWDLSGLQAPKAPQIQMYAPGLLGMAQQGMSNYHNNAIDEQNGVPTLSSAMKNLGNSMMGGSNQNDTEGASQSEDPMFLGSQIDPPMQRYKTPQYDPVSRSFLPRGMRF